MQIPVAVLEGSGADACSASGRFPVQIHVEVPGPGSFTIVQRHCMLVCV